MIEILKAIGITFGLLSIVVAGFFVISISIPFMIFTGIAIVVWAVISKPDDDDKRKYGPL